MFNLAFVPFEHYSFSDAMNVVITGLVVVFLILLLLVVIFAFTGKLMAPKKKEKAEAKSAPSVNADVQKAGDDLSLVAAITAALSEYLGNGNFVIKKIRPAKIGKKSFSPWSADGKRQNTRPF